MGLAMRGLLPALRWALTPPFHPYPRKRGRSVLCGAFPGVTPAGRYPASSPHGVRTFLATHGHAVIQPPHRLHMTPEGQQVNASGHRTVTRHARPTPQPWPHSAHHPHPPRLWPRGESAGERPQGASLHRKADSRSGRDWHPDQQRPAPCLQARSPPLPAPDAASQILAPDPICAQAPYRNVRSPRRRNRPARHDLAQQDNQRIHLRRREGPVAGIGDFNPDAARVDIIPTAPRSRPRVPGAMSSATSASAWPDLSISQWALTSASGSQSRCRAEAASRMAV